MLKGASKKGISAVVATVLIILVTVAGIAILWTAVLPMIKESSDTSFVEAGNLEILTSEGYTAWNPSNLSMSVQVKRGVGEVDLEKIQFVFKSATESIPFILSDIPEEGQSKVYYFNLSVLGSKPTGVTIAPISSTGKYGAISSEVVSSQIRDGSFIADLITVGEEIDEDCVPSCSGKECGSDGCGGSCGSCGDLEVCDAGSCITTCSEVMNCTSWRNISCGLGDNLDKMMQNRTCSCGDFDTEQNVSGTVCELMASAISWWSFDDGTANDLKGLNNGTKFGNIDCTVEGAYGRGRACYFDGAGDYFRFPNSASYQLVGNASRSTVFLINVPVVQSSYHNIFFSWGPGSVWIAALNSGRSMMRIGSSSSLGITTVSTNTWIDLAITYNSTDSVFSHYYDGALNNTQTVAYVAKVATIQLYMGSNGGGGGEFLNGTLDEVMIFNKTLSSEEVAEIHAYLSRA